MLTNLEAKVAQQLGEWILAGGEGPEQQVQTADECSHEYHHSIYSIGHRLMDDDDLLECLGIDEVDIIEHGVVKDAENIKGFGVANLARYLDQWEKTVTKAKDGLVTRYKIHPSDLKCFQPLDLTEEMLGFSDISWLDLETALEVVGVDILSSICDGVSFEGDHYADLYLHVPCLVLVRLEYLLEEVIAAQVALARYVAGSPSGTKPSVPDAM